MYHTRHALVTRVLSLCLTQLQNQVQMYLHEQHQGKHGPWNIWVRTIHTLCTEIAHETEGRKQNNEQPGESPSDLYSAQQVWSSTQQLRKAWEPFTVNVWKKVAQIIWNRNERVIWAMPFLPVLYYANCSGERKSTMPISIPKQQFGKNEIGEGKVCGLQVCLACDKGSVRSKSKAGKQGEMPLIS